MNENAFGVNDSTGPFFPTLYYILEIKLINDGGWSSV